MKPDAGRKWLRVLVTVLGLVMVVAGALTVLLGAASVPREGVVTPDVDSEMRFYAVWYVAMGVVLLRSAPRVETESVVIRLAGGGFFVAGCARILSWIAVGRPHASQVALLVIELMLPLVIIPWQASVARRWRTSDR